jgi:hypothetical protein
MKPFSWMEFICCLCISLHLAVLCSNLKINELPWSYLLIPNFAAFVSEFITVDVEDISSAK